MSDPADPSQHAWAMLLHGSVLVPMSDLLMSDQEPTTPCADVWSGTDPDGEWKGAPAIALL
jgi:hypothetical protein